jgi:hypothetical protein
MPLNRLALFSLATVAVGSAGALADPVFVGHINIAASYGSNVPGAGGEYRVWGQADFTSLAPPSTGTGFEGFPATAGYFESFAVEMFDHPINFAIDDFKADLNTVTASQDAEYASGNHGGFNDELDARTAYLYSHFISMTLTTPYDYSNAVNRAADANAMQRAIWFIEQEDSTPLDGKALDFWNEANNAVMSGNWIGTGNVQIMNVYTNSSRVDYQDMLVIVPLPGGAGLAAMGLAGLTGIAALRRRR